MTGNANFQKAYIAFQGGRFAECIQLLDPALESEKPEPTTLLIAAQCHMKLGNGSEAEALYKHLATLQPSNKETFLKMAADAAALANTQHDSSNWPLSPALVDQMLVSLNSAPPLAVEIMNLYRQGAFDQAANRFDMLIATRAISNPSVPIVVLAGICNERIGNIDKAAHFLGNAGLQPGLHQITLLKAAFNLFQKLLHEKSAIPDIGYETAKRLVQLEPRNFDAAVYYRYAMHTTCAIEDLRNYNAKALAGLKEKDTFFQTNEILHSHLCWCADEALNASIENKAPDTTFTEASREKRKRRPHTFSNKIRIGYLTADLYAEHPTSILFKGVLAAHDPAKFEITLYCYTQGKFSDTDLAFRKTLPNLVVVKNLSDQQVADLIRKRGTDILVDLKGPTSEARSDILNIGGAPIQAAWLGFPGSGTGIDCDYIISDPIVTPDSAIPFYHEKFCRLPDSYQCNDGMGRPLPASLTKADLGISENTFLFACFNSMNKFSPQIVDLWADILHRVEGSKLALFNNHARQKQNFLSAMANKGLGEDRFHFLPRASYRDHLARIPAADLGLDCYPYNGHTTTSDMLWMGLPLLTFKGSNFASRVSESLLKSLGMDELVANNAEAFVEQAVSLAAQPETLATLREKIVSNRFRAPLFDTERFTRHLERGFEIMVERHKAGQAPDHFDVPPLPARDAPFR